MKPSPCQPVQQHQLNAANVIMQAINFHTKYCFKYHVEVHTELNGVSVCLFACKLRCWVCSSFCLTNWTDLSLSKADKSQAQLFPYQRSSSAVQTNLFHVWRGVQKCTNTWEETRASCNACRKQGLCFILTHPTALSLTQIPVTCLSIHQSSMCVPLTQT